MRTEAGRARGGEGGAGTGTLMPAMCSRMWPQDGQLFFKVFVNKKSIGTASLLVRGISPLVVPPFSSSSLPRCSACIRPLRCIEAQKAAGAIKWVCVAGGGRGEGSLSLLWFRAATLPHKGDSVVLA